jgi:uncharacterized phage protein (TIGR01671 family)
MNLIRKQNDSCVSKKGRNEMREIKFRAAIKETGEVFPVLTIWDNSVCLDTTKSRYEWDCKVYSKEEVILLQYTGLKDRNGTEIYEGDIVKWTRVTFEDCSRTVIEKTEDIIGEVYWCETMWAIGRNGSGYLLMPYFVETDKFEVLGNIYGNSELLEGKE